MATKYNRQLATRATMEKMFEKALPTSICNVISRIYFAIDNEKAKRDCRLAITIAKAMSKKLKEYSELEKTNND
jgi:hypothetical protein